MAFYEKKKKNLLFNPNPQGDSSFVVMTNYIITEGQKMGKCPEVGENTQILLFQSLLLCDFLILSVFPFPLQFLHFHK